AAAPIKLSQGDVLVSGSNPNQVLASAAPKTSVHWVDQGDQLIPTYENGPDAGKQIPGLAREPKHMTPDQQAGVMKPAEQPLDAALTQAGVQLQVTRSWKMYAQRFNALIAANPGVSPADIADQVRTGQIDFNGTKRSAGQLATTLAATNASAKKM